MSFVNDLLKVFVGDKTKKDLKSILPLVDKIKSHENFEQLSHDELRQKPLLLNKKLKRHVLNLINRLNSTKQLLITQKILIKESNL